MVKTLVAVVGLMLVIGANAFERYIPNARHPDTPDKCFVKATEEFIEFGKSITPKGMCARYNCRDDFVIHVNECGRYMRPDNCEIIPRDLSQSYPDCCPKLMCIDNADGTIEISNTSS